MNNNIKFTQNAIDKIEHLISSKPTGTFFRISVKGGGCSGFKYDFSFDKELKKDDQSFKNKILIDNQSLNLLDGSEIDFKSELIGDSFHINNPKVKSSCGCGISFSL